MKNLNKLLLASTLLFNVACKDDKDSGAIAKVEKNSEFIQPRLSCLVITPELENIVTCVEIDGGQVPTQNESLVTQDCVDFSLTQSCEQMLEQHSSHKKLGSCNAFITYDDASPDINTTLYFTSTNSSSDEARELREGIEQRCSNEYSGTYEFPWSEGSESGSESGSSPESLEESQPEGAAEEAQIDQTPASSETLACMSSAGQINFCAEIDISQLDQDAISQESAGCELTSLTKSCPEFISETFNQTTSFGRCDLTITNFQLIDLDVKYYYFSTNLSFSDELVSNVSESLSESCTSDEAGGRYYTPDTL